MKLFFAPAVLFFSLCLPNFCLAGPEGTTSVAPSPFDVGHNELEFSGRYFYSPVITIGHRPVWTWGEGDVSWGLMLNSPTGPGLLRGNWEFLVNSFGAGIIRGPGSYLLGSRAQIRYNFVQPQSRFVPFITLGFGGLLNDAFQNRSQCMIGGRFEFTLTAEGGVRYFITNHWTLNATVNFQHISNAGTCTRNEGANGLGAGMGFGYIF